MTAFRVAGIRSANQQKEIDMYDSELRNGNYDTARLTQAITPELESAIRDAAGRNRGGSAQAISDDLADRGVTAHLSSVRAVLGL